MNHSSTFNPDWVSPPGQTLFDLLNQKQIELTAFFKMLSITSAQGQKLIDGRAPITTDLAQKLEEIVDVPVHFWINRELQYRQLIAKLEEEQYSWLDRLPLRDMVSGGWIPKGLTKAQKVDSCLKFFGVSSLDQWDDRYYRKLSMVSFKTSNSFDTVPESVIAWLRRAELVAGEVECSDWNRNKLEASVSDIRTLTRVANPQDFLPPLKRILANCGVALAIVKAPSGCRASGATYFVTPEKALLILSFRHLSDDHFWFSLFHEIGHLLLHNKESMFIEDKSIEKSQEEIEADEYAASTLIPKEFQSEMYSYTQKDWKKIIRLAKRVGVSPGIVLGQLQHHGNIRHEYLNRLKVRYKWG